MAIVVEGTDGFDTADSDPQTFAVSIPSGTDTIVLYYGGLSADGFAATVTLDPGGGDEATFTLLQEDLNGFLVGGGMWYLNQVSVSGSYNIQIDNTIGAPTGHGQVGCLFLSGTDVSTASACLRDSNEELSTSFSYNTVVALTGETTGDLVVLAGSAGSNPASANYWGSPATEALNNAVSGIYAFMAHDDGSQGDPDNDSLDYPYAVGAAFIPGAGGGASPHIFLPLLGVG